MTIPTSTLKKACSVLAGIFLSVSLLEAVPAPKQPQTVIQPDGTVLTIILHGDEHLSWITTLDGYSVMKNREGFFEYVSHIAEGEAILSGIKAKNEENRSLKDKRILKKIPKQIHLPRVSSMPDQTLYHHPKIQSANTGEWLWLNTGFAEQTHFDALCVIVNFPDYPLSHSREAIDSLLNCPGYSGHGNHGSVYDYFHDMSGGRFNFHVDVLPPYTALEARDRYGKYGDGLKAEVYNYIAGILGREMARYDKNKDGIIDHISIIFAGQGQEMNAGTNYIWSHSGTYSSRYGSDLDGINFAMIAEIDNGQNRLGMATYCHEFGHVLGLPDIYDADYEGSGGLTAHPDNHCLMASNNGDGHPVPLSAFLRYTLDWTSLKTLNSKIPGTYTINDVLSDPFVLRINTATKGEFFVLENRTPLNKWQTNPDQGHGLLIFRVDSVFYKENLKYNTINTRPEHLAYSVIRADNDATFDTEKSDFFPYGGKYTAFTDQTTPSAVSLSGENTSQPLTHITEDDHKISFDYIASGSTLLVNTYEARYDSIGRIEVKAGVIPQPASESLLEKGVCYGVLPNPTVNSAKEQYEGPETEFTLSLRNLNPQNDYYVRAYAKKSNNDVVYGAVKKASTADYSVAVKADPYYKTTENSIPVLDISALTNPILTLYNYTIRENRIYVSKPQSPLSGSIRVRSAASRDWEEVEPYSIESKIKNEADSSWGFAFTVSFKLPEPSSFYEIYIPSSYDSALVSGGEELTITDLPFGEKSKYVLSDYGKSLKELVNQKIIRLNTSGTDRPRLFKKGPNQEEGAVYIKTDGDAYYRKLIGKTDIALSTNPCNRPLYYKVETYPNSSLEKLEKAVYAGEVFDLPKSDDLNILLLGYTEIYLYDETEGLPQLIEIYPLSNTTVEIRGIENSTANPAAETGICWNRSGNTPDLSHTLPLSANGSYFIKTFFDLPADQNISFRSYLKKGDHVTFSSAFTSDIIAGQRENIQPRDTANPVEVLACKTDGSYTVRVRYNPKNLENDPLAQGIYYAFDEINTSSPSLYREGEIREADYFTFDYTIPDANNNQDSYDRTWLKIMPFILDKNNSFLLDDFSEVKSCPFVDLNQGSKTFTLPHAFGTDDEQHYWTFNRNSDCFLSEIHTSAWEKTFQIKQRYSVMNIDTVRFISPLIVQTDAVNPVVDFTVYELSLAVDLYAIDAGNGRRTRLTTLQPVKEYSTQRYLVNTDKSMDSIYLCFEVPNTRLTMTLKNFEIRDEETFFVKTEATDLNGKVTFYGTYQENPNLPEVSECGFIYSTGGDPYRCKYDPAYACQSYDSIVVPGQSTEFTADIHSELTHLYVRAYVKNSNGFSYGDCQKVTVCGDYTVMAGYLPATDNFEIAVWEAGDFGKESEYLYETRINPCTLDKSGILNLHTRPAVHKIEANTKISLYTEYDAYRDPENLNESILPLDIRLYYRIEGSDQWVSLPDESFELAFESSGLVALGSNLSVAYYTLKAYLPRNFSQLRCESTQNRSVRAEFRLTKGSGSIHYTESDIADITATVPTINYVTVENKALNIDWAIDDLTNVESLRLYREGSQAGKYDLLKEYASSEITALSGRYTDLTTLPETKAYTYILKSVNSEGTEFAGTSHKSIHLSINKGIQNQWNLYWNPYEGRPVASVRIYRGDNENDLIYIDEIPGGNNTYTDVNAPEGDVYYVIETLFAENRNGKPAKAQILSRSNVASNLPASQRYIIDITQNPGGTVIVTCNGQNVSPGSALDSGSNLELKAIPDDKFEFVQWYNGSKEAEITTRLLSDMNISATFRPRVSNEDSEKQTLTLWPNPVREDLHILSGIDIHRIEICDLSGKTILKNETKGKEFRIPMQNIGTGLYLVKCHTTHGLVTRKILVE